MATQMTVLEECNIKVDVDGGIPFIEDKDYHRALAIIWVDGIAGWWNYEEEFIKHDICTKGEFWKKLKRE